MSIPEIAASKIDLILSQKDTDNARTIFVVGSKQCGKSTLLNAVLDKTDTPRPTLVLEYCFGRKSNQTQGIEKTICHLWEYGGKLEALKDVISFIPVKGRFYYCVVVDLSKIKRIWDTLETCIQIMMASYAPETMPEIIIVGSKYDVFKNYDSELKKFICVTLRCLALLFKAHLIFYSSQEPNLAKRAKELFQSVGFGNEAVFKEKNTNSTKPLLIPKDHDTWESIGISPLTLEQLKVRHLSRIPPEPVDSSISTDKTNQNLVQAHPEPIIDKLAAHKYEQLRASETIDMALDDYLVAIRN